MIYYDKAILLAKIIQQQNPDFLVAGSLALMLAGCIPKGDVHDIDFSSKSQQSIFYNKDKKSTPASIVQSHKEFTCYGFKRFESDYTFFKYDVFYYPDLIEGGTVDGLKFQSIDQILYWKRKFNRPKDREVLSRIDNMLDDILLDL